MHIRCAKATRSDIDITKVLGRVKKAPNVFGTLSYKPQSICIQHQLYIYRTTHMIGEVLFSDRFLEIRHLDFKLYLLKSRFPRGDTFESDCVIYVCERRSSAKSR